MVVQQGASLGDLDQQLVDVRCLGVSADDPPRAPVDVECPVRRWHRSLLVRLSGGFGAGSDAGVVTGESPLDGFGEVVPQEKKVDFYLRLRAMGIFPEAELADGTIRGDVGKLERLRTWFGRPLWDMEPADADAYFGRVLRAARLPRQVAAVAAHPRVRPDRGAGPGHSLRQ
ncbi:hypothetical protein [Streptomyces sp. RerS4]|uniref:hypothetical protein n=1 Tax=Streptomyces sp. RerS4 TaxID=2942449 RepID=UPI00201C5A96|nr:hypothetical protein [Streptomyces sp. RerS4]UQX05286.1 hypothetical protein M4D82_00950 [Streptomyces sp. RerS4]